MKNLQSCRYWKNGYGNWTQSEVKAFSEEKEVLPRKRVHCRSGFTPRLNRREFQNFAWGYRGVKPLLRSYQDCVKGSGRSPSAHMFLIDVGRSEIARYLLALLVFVVGCSPSPDRQVVLIVNGVDESAGGVPCYIVETPTATYFLEKEGGGLSSMLDRDGVDWLGFHKEPGSQSQGEYRGFPNAIHRQDGSYFHALNAGTDPSTSRVETVESDFIRIVFDSGNGKWQGRWDFFPDRCVFTMAQVSEGYRYWILYEGVPGGTLDKDDFWYSSIDDKAHLIDERNDGDLPGPEWIAFGDPGTPRMLYLHQHEDDSHPDRYYNMRDEMTVFGFGRKGIEKYLDKPLSFSIGFAESTDYEEVRRAALGR